MAITAGPLRLSPSGEFIVGENDGDVLVWSAADQEWQAQPGGGGGAVDSVFGRTGVVVAVSGDYDTSLITNVSTVVGPTASDALDTLQTTIGNLIALIFALTSTNIANISSVPGATVTDALNTLLSNNAVGALHESFSGGTALAVTTASTNANIGDLNWNLFTSIDETGLNVSRLSPPPAGRVGVLRMTSSLFGGQAFLYLGSSTNLNVFDAATWASCTWRARFKIPTGTEFQAVGLNSVTNNIFGSIVRNACFIADNSLANWRTITAEAGGNFSHNTGVPIDNLFHDFTIVRVSSTRIEFYIDGVLVTTHTAAGGDGMPVGEMGPMAQVVGGAASVQALLDLDNFTFTPI